MIQIGQEAPDFKLFNTDKKEIALSDYRGKNVVVLFFPLAFTSTCTEELCNMRDNIAYYNGLNAVILGISVDSLFTQKKFKEEQALTFDLLSDFNKTTATAYGALYADWGFGWKGVTKRASFVIDAKGIVRHVEVQENAGELPNFQAINTALETI